MEIGIDSFAATPPASDRAMAIGELIDRIVLSDQEGLDYFGLGEHHRAEFLDSAAHMILAAAAAKTTRIRLGSAVTVISAADPVRVFQNYATLDLISNGRAEIVAGRGSFTEAFPLFGYRLGDYDPLFREKLELLLRIRDEETITWSGRFRAPLEEQAVYPRPVQKKLPVWLGVGGTPASFVRAGTLGLPLMVAVIGGETHRFRPLIDAYRAAGAEAGHAPETLKVGLHSLGYVAKTTELAHETYFPGYQEMFTKIGEERGFGPVTMHSYMAQTGKTGALVVGNLEKVAAKIRRHAEALGGIDRFTFQMDAGIGHEDLCRAIELIGREVKPRVG
ncbi:LLM class flavin-dependent oxidoreductase [Neolewinella aurantiaca]|uniref:LLM class flavin-dependent oxidoreductase n=1 Tax=Neolewinella aurantiaca TaxID=2602767 RepID=A0A5C7FPR2_9BACT|nr:LLM class flavin-dependent oxidoreductase [Neolewinella aurantiaca]TXF88426.1 LLM class flavin-dependent oxidoreductase [Neolewinella aurantiaca]